MPNQRDRNKLHTSITLPKEVVAALDQIAVREDRSRTYIIARILREQVEKFEASEDIDIVAPPKKGQKSAC